DINKKKDNRDIKDNKQYTKIISIKEERIIEYILKKDENILPKILERNQIMISYEKNFFTLHELYESKEDISKYYTKIKELIDKLHNIGIIHGDLNSNNIVINPKTDDVRLINFDKSYFITQINQK